MDGLDHGVAVPDVGAARRADTALQLCSLVGDDVAVEVRQQQHLKLPAHPLVDEVRRHDINIVIINGDLRIVGSHLMAEGGELAVRLFEDVRLRDDGHARLAVAPGIVERRAGDAACAGVGRDLEVHGHAGQLHAAAAEGVLALRVLAEERPVDALLGDGHGADVRVEVERAAQLHVRALESAAHGRRGRALEQHVAGQNFREHIVRHRLIAGQPVFDREAADAPQGDAAARDLIGEQHLEHAHRLLHDDRADAVAVHKADGHGRFFRIVHPLGGHARDAGLLLSQQRAKRRTGAVNIVHSACSFVSVRLPAAIPARMPSMRSCAPGCSAS